MSRTAVLCRSNIIHTDATAEAAQHPLTPQTHTPQTPHITMFDRECEVNRDQHHASRNAMELSTRVSSIACCDGGGVYHMHLTSSCSSFISSHNCSSTSCSRGGDAAHSVVVSVSSVDRPSILLSSSLHCCSTRTVSAC